MQNNPATANELCAGTICFDANLSLQMPSKTKGTVQTWSPEIQVFILSALLMWQDFGKASYSKLTLLKMLEPVGSLTLFFGVAK